MPTNFRVKACCASSILQGPKPAAHAAPTVVLKPSARDLPALVIALQVLRGSLHMSDAPPMTHFEGSCIDAANDFTFPFECHILHQGRFKEGLSHSIGRQCHRASRNFHR